MWNNCVYFAGITDKNQILKIAENYVASGVKVSAFGIGKDFDEVLMKGLAKSGNGEYFFIDSAGSIPKIVSKAIHGLMDITANDVSIKMCGGNGLLVNTIYGQEHVDLVLPLKLGDLLADNTKKILLEVEVSCANVLLKPTLSWELVYSAGESNSVTTLHGTFTFETTNDENALQSQCPEVIVALKIKEASQIDKNIANLISQKKISEAISIKESMLEELKKISSLDAHGHLSKIIQKGEKALVGLKTKTNLALASKQFHNLGYVQDEDDDHGYESAEDSDEGAYSDQETQPPRSYSMSNGSAPESPSNSDSENS